MVCCMLLVFSLVSDALSFRIGAVLLGFFVLFQEGAWVSVLFEGVGDVTQLFQPRFGLIYSDELIKTLTFMP